LSAIRVLRAVALGLAGLGGIVVGLAGVGLGTEAGREVVVATALRVALSAVRGSVAVDSTAGGVYDGLVAFGVHVAGEDGRPLIDIPRLQVRYRVRDFLSRRIVLGELSLSGARVTLERLPGGRFNYQQVLRLGEGSGGGGPSLLVAFRNVTVDSLRVLIRTPRGDSTVMHERVIEVPRALLPYVRLSSPFPGERGIRLDVAALKASASEPALDIRDAQGSVEVRGDTIAFDLDRAELPGTQSTMRGRMWELARGPRVDLAFRADAFASRDLSALFGWLVPGLTGTGALTVRSESDSVLRVRGEQLDLTAASGGSIRGSFGARAGPGQDWATERLDVTTRDFDVAYLRGLLDTVPVDGRVTGRTRMDGPRTAVRQQIDWVFRDRRADSAETQIRGSGVIAFGGTEGIVFRKFQVEFARVALATVHVIAPSVELRGDVEGAGVLDGPWRNVTFTGLLAHIAGDLPVSHANGTIRLDTRSNTVGVWGALQFDSLQFDGVRPSYPQAVLAGAMAGDVHLAGYLDSLSLVVDLAGPGGALQGGGTVVLAAPRLGAHDLDVRFRRLTLEPLERRMHGTALNGTLTGDVEVDSLAPPVMDLALVLGPSLLGDARLDTVRAHVRVRDSVLLADTLELQTRGVAFVGRGGLGLTTARRDSLVLQVQADSMGSLAPLLLQLAGRDTAALAGDTLTGTVRGEVTLSGSLDRLSAAWSLDGPRLTWNGVHLRGTRTAGRFDAGGRGAIAAQLDVDSVLVGTRVFPDLVAAVVGRGDSLNWIALGGIGDAAGVRAGGIWFARSPDFVVRFDSLVLAAAADEWRLEPGATATVGDSAIALTGMTLATADGRSRATLRGAVPRAGSATVEGSIETLPLPDVWALLQRDTGAVAGQLSGTFQVGGRASAPEIKGSFSMRDAVFSEYRTPLVDGSIDYRARRLTGTLNTWRGGTRILTVELDLPLDLGFHAVERRRLPGPITVRGRADGVDLSLLSAMTPMVRRTEGRLSADLGITGTWETPWLTGSVEIQDGAATFPALGVRHQQIFGRLVLSGDTIRVDTLSAASGEGTAAVRGIVRLAELTRPVLDLSITADNFSALAIPDFLTLTTSGAVKLTGPVYGATLTGTGTIPRGVVHFADIVEKQIVNLEDTLGVLDSATAALIRKQGLGPSFESRFLDSLRIVGLGLTMGNDVHLRSTEADIFLSGQVTVGKVADHYRIDGTLQTPRGTYQLYLRPTPVRKAFTVTRGEVRYFGTPDLNAALDIDARHQLRGTRGEVVQVYVHLGGTILEPQLRLSSDVQPPLTDAEIISYLVLGAPSAEAASGEVGRYGLESITSLSSQISGSLGGQLIADLGIPLDFLEVRPQFGARGFEATEIAFGRQIGDRWFLTVSPRLCRKQAFTLQNVGGTLEFRVAQHWSLLASADPVRVCSLSGTGSYGAQLQLGIDVLWERRF
jgi:autotransporter translocation and assembly factor TamB